MKRLNSLLSNIAKLLSLLLCLALSTTVAKTSNLYDDFQAEYWDLEDDDDWFFKDNDETEEYDTYDDEYLDDYHDQTISEVSYEKVIWGTCFLILGVGGIIGLYKTYTNVPLQHNPLSDKRETTPIPQKPPKKPTIEDVQTLAIPKEKKPIISIYDQIKEKKNIPKFPGDKIIYTQYSPNKKWLVVATKSQYDIDLYLYKLETKEWYLLRDLGRDKKNSCNHIRKGCCLAFSQDSQYLAAYGIYKTPIYVWKVATQQLIVAHDINLSLVSNKEDDKWTWKLNKKSVKFTSPHNLYFDKEGTLNFLFACPKAENTHHYELVKWSLSCVEINEEIGSLFENKPPSELEKECFKTKNPLDVSDNVQYENDNHPKLLKINKNASYIVLYNQPSEDSPTQYIYIWNNKKLHLNFPIKNLKNIFFCGENEEVLGVYTKDNILTLVNLTTQKGVETITLPDTIESIKGTKLFFECYEKSIMYIYQLEKSNDEDAPIGYKVKKVANINHHSANRIISKELNIAIEYNDNHDDTNIYDFSINPTNWQIESVQKIIAGKLRPNNKECKFNHPKD